MKRYLLLPTSLPAYVEGILFILLANIFLLAEGIRWNKSTWTFEAVWRPWFEKHWLYSTTMGHGTIWQAQVDRRIQQHEPVHTRQIEDLLLLSFLCGLAYGVHSGNFGWFLGTWFSGIAWQLPNFLTAWLRGGHPYRDAEHERSAYAQTDTDIIFGTSWLGSHRPR